MADHDPAFDFDEDRGGGTPIDLGIVRRFVANVWTFKWLVVIAVAAAVGGAYAYTERLTPIYQSTATFLLDPRPPQILGREIQEVAPIGTSPWDSNRREYYNAQLYILRSKMLAQRSVEEGRLHESKTIIGDMPVTKENEAQRIRVAVGAVLSSVRIVPPKEDRIIRVVATHPMPDAAAQMANSHVRAYVNFNLSLRTQGSETASEWLAKELTAAEEDLRKAESDVFDFKRNNEMLYVSLEDQRNMVTGNIKRFTDAVNDAKVKRIEAELYFKRIVKAREGQLLDSALFDLAENGTGSGLKAEYYQATSKLERLGQIYGPKHPEYQQQKKSVDKILGALESEADIIVKAAKEKHQSAVATEQAFAAELAKHKAIAFELGPKEIDYNRLVRRERSDEERYRVVLNQLRDSQITGRLTTVNVRPMDDALPAGAPIGPSLRNNVSFAAGVAIAGSFGLLLLITLLDRRITGPEELESLSGATLLGVIPRATSERGGLDLLVHEEPTSSIAEACRNLRTNLLYAGADKPFQTLVITSPNEREGKTTASMQLATAIAQSDQRVIIVESDLRRPRLATANGVPGRHGLSNLILGEVELADAVKTTDVPNLFLLPAGSTPPNPSELLMTSRFRDVVETLKSEYDIVIFDSPPVLAVTDASILASQADATLLLVKSEQTLRETVRRAAQQLRAVDARMAGIVLNALDLQKRIYGYYSRYGYGYGYGEVPDSDARARA